MDIIKRQINFIAIYLLTFVFFLSVVVSAFAHGGEDHGDENKSAAVTNDKGTISQTIKVGDLEFLLKHAPVEPDTASAARLFVTRFASNEPFVSDAPTVSIVAPDGKSYVAEAIKSDAPGSFTIKLPPLTEGAYTISATLNSGDKSGTATFSNVAVIRAHETPITENAFSRLWNILLAAAFVAVFGGIIVLGYFALRYAQRGREAVSA